MAHETSDIDNDHISAFIVFARLGCKRISAYVLFINKHFQYQSRHLSDLKQRDVFLKHPIKECKDNQ